jgi:4-methylaminobutanoate oxidase (formaldehyde-forming)
LRASALHAQWAAQGAVFGVTAGWERGLWYARDNSERNLPYSVGAQSRYPVACREAAEMATGAVLLDLSPFGKFDVEGPGALAFLQHLTTASMDVPVGRAVYTLMTNARGGIEADVTILRRGEAAFRITSGAATRWKDMAWLRRHAGGWDVRISDVTEDEVVIGVMGGRARDILSAVSPDDWWAFPFSTANSVSISGKNALATRLSFVGELGWELSIPVSEAGEVFDALIAQGARPMGHFALDGCRIEKGFRHWGHDLGPEISPLEAGLGFAVDWSKEFLGKAALEAQREAGLSRRLVLFDLPGHPLVLHDEPIRENGRVVGMTTSGARGVRTGMTLALGMVDVAPGEGLAATAERKFEIEIAGRCYAADVLLRPPFDPKGERMRG